MTTQEEQSIARTYHQSRVKSLPLIVRDMESSMLQTSLSLIIEEVSMNTIPSNSNTKVFSWTLPLLLKINCTAPTFRIRDIVQKPLTKSNQHNHLTDHHSIAVVLLSKTPLGQHLLLLIVRQAKMENLGLIKHRSLTKMN